MLTKANKNSISWCYNYRMKWAVVSLFFLFPSLTFGAVGFTSDPVWLSRTPAYENEKISVYASLTNSTEEVLRAVAYFRDNGTLIDTLPVSLQPGEARILTISWTPTKGKHTLAVEIASSTIDLPAKTKTTSVSVLAKEEQVPQKGLLNGPSQAAAATYSDSSIIQGAIGKLSPTVQAYTSPVFGFIDSKRQKFSDFLNDKAEKTRTVLSNASLQKKALEGKSDRESQKASRQYTISQFVNTALLYVFEALALLTSSALLSYGVFVLLVIYVCYKIFRYFRPAY